MVGNSFPVNISIMHVARSVEHIIGWLVLISQVPWPEFLVASRIISVVIVVPAVPTAIALIVVLVFYGHLAVGVVVAIISRSSYVVVVPVRPVIFR
jgi:hypothetical protein